MSTRRHRSTTSRFTGTRLGRLMLAGPLVGLMSVPALAGPEGEQVVHGSASFHRNGHNTIIRTSNRAIINYSGFDLTSQESVRFIQAGANARVLNRIQSGTPTFIDGSVTANGSVYFVNNAGIVFGNNAVFNVGGLFAAAGNISNRDFIAGRDRFTDVTGEVINNGHIESSGSIGLVGHRVANYGSIVAPEGMVTMAAGDDVYIGERGGHVFARISSSADNAATGGVEQGGSIESRGAMLSVGDHFALAVLDSSSIRTQRLTVRGGEEGSVVTVGGEIDATTEGGRGGRVDVFGETVRIDGAQIDASGDTGGGVIRIGGDYQGQGKSPTSDLTLVTRDALIRADALLSGNGGKVIVWGNDFTGFAGFISARGGALNGNGGFVEVSGKEVLAYRGLSDLRATNGRAGKLLLDPRFIDIVDGAPGDWPINLDDNRLEFFEDTDTVTITDAELSAQLDLLAGGGEILLQAARDIRVQDTVEVVSTGDGLLILEAGRRVRFIGNASIDMGTGSLRVIGNSDGYTPSEFDRGGGNGDINMSAGSSIITNGGTIEFLLQNFENSANISVSTINAGDGLVRLIHTGVQGTSNHHISQVAGGSGITAGTIEIASTTGGRAGVNNASRLILDTASLSVTTASGDTFLNLTGLTDITSIATSNANIDIVATDAVSASGDLNAGTGQVRIEATEIATSGGEIVGSGVSLEATTGGIGAVDAALSVTTDLLSASAQDGIFLNTQDQGGAGLTVGSFNGVDGLTSVTGTIELDHDGDLTIDRDISATGHGLSEDVILVTAGTATVTGTGGVAAGATGGIVFNTDSLVIDGDMGMSGRAATFNVGAGGVSVDGVFGGAFEAVTIETLGTLAINAGGRLATTGDLAVTAAAFDIVSGDGLNGDTSLLVASQTNLDANAAFLAELETGGVLTLSALDGNTTIGGQVALFTTATEVIVNASQQIVFEGVEPTAYAFSALTATGGSGIEFAGEVSGLDVVGAGLLDGGEGDLVVLRSGVFALSGATLDLRGNLLAQQAGGGLTIDGIVDVSTGDGRYDILTDTGGLVVDGTINSGGRNIQLVTAGGAMAINGLVDSNGLTDGNIVLNIGAGTLAFAPAGTRLDAGDGAVALIADSWSFDGAFLDSINAAGVTILSQVGDTVITGPGAIAPTIDLVQIRSDLGFVRLEGAGTYLFNSVVLDGGAGVEFGADVVGLTATGQVTLDAQENAIDVQNLGLFTLTSGAGGTILNSDIGAAGDLQFIGAIDATNSQGLPSPSGDSRLNLTVAGTLMLDDGLDAGTRGVTIDATNATLGGILATVDLLILSDEVSIGNDNGGFWLSNAFLDLTTADSVRVGELGNEATQVWLDGIATTFNQILTVNTNLVDAINNDSAIDNIALTALDRILIDGVRLEITGDDRDLHLEAINGVLTTDGATLAASGLNGRVDLHSDVSGTGMLTFDAPLQINGGGIRLISRDAGDTGTIRFVGDVDAAADEGISIDAADGVISFASGQVGQNSAFSSIEMTAGGGVMADGPIDIRSSGSVTFNNDLTAGGTIGIELDADGTADGTDVGTFVGLNSDVAEGTAGISITNGAGDAGNVGITLNGLARTDGGTNEGIDLNAGTGTIDILGGIESNGGNVMTFASLTTQGSNISSGGGSVVIGSGLLVSGDRSIFTEGGDVAVIGLTAIDGSLDIDTTIGLGAGTVTFEDAIIGATPGAGDLLIDAGGGIVNLNGSVGRTGEDRHLNLLAVNAADEVHFRGSNYEATTLSFTFVDGGFFIDRVGGGTVEFTSRGSDITFDSAPIQLRAGNDVSFTALDGGLITLTDILAEVGDDDAVVTVRSRETVTFANLGDAGQLLGVVDVIVGDDVQAGLAVFTGSSFSDVYEIAADEVNFLGGLDSVTGRDMTLTQRELDRGINLGGDGTDATRLNLTKDEVDAFADGFDIIRIGDANTGDVMVIDNPGDVSLVIRDLFELRAKNAVSVLSGIEGTGNGSLSMFSGSATLLAADVALDSGNLFAGDLAGGPGRVVIQETVNLSTNGGSVNMAGSIDGAGVTDDALFIDAGPGGTIVLGAIGQGDALSTLDVFGGTINIGDIGDTSKAGVTGGTLVEADDELHFDGSIYNTNEARFIARRGMTAVSDIEFRSNDSDLTFGSTAQRGRGSISFADRTVWTANAGSGTLGLDGHYEGDRVDMMLTGSSIMLNGNASFANPGGSVVFDGPLVGRRNVMIDVANGEVRFLGNVGSNTDSSIRLRDMDIAARQIDFLGSRVDADSAHFAATRYSIDPQGTPPIQTFKMANGDLVFDGGLILFPTGQLNLNAERGSLTVAEVRGGLDAIQLVTMGRDGVTLFGVGSGNNSGVDQLLVQGDEIEILGDMFVRGRTLLRPFNDGVAIDVGSDLIADNGILEISETMLSRFMSTRVGSSLSIGGISTLDDLESPVNPDLFSNSQITIRDITIGRQATFFGADIELVDGATLSMTDGAPVRLSSVGTSRLNGSILSDGGVVVINGQESILNGLIATSGGDIIIRSENAFVDGGVDLNTLGGPTDGDFIVDGGIDGLVDGTGDFVLNVGRGDITIAPDRGFGQTRRLRSVDLTANRLHLTNVFTTGDQNFVGTELLQLSGGDIDSIGGTIRFNNLITVAGDQFVGIGSEGTIFIDDAIMGASGKSGRFLTLAAAPGGTVEFRGDASGVDGLIVDADALVFGDTVFNRRSFSGGEVRFLGTVDSGSGKVELEIHADSIAELATDVGANGPFQTLRVSAGDQIVLGQSGEPMRIDTCSQQLFEGDTRIAGDVFLQSHGTESGVIREDSILFLGDVNGTTAGADMLTAIVDRSFGERIDISTPPSNVPIIGFNGDIGSTTRLGGLNLNFAASEIDGRVNDAGDAFASVVATIVFGDVDAFKATGSTTYESVVRVDELNMGRGEAMTVIGSLDLAAARGRLSDVSTLNDMRLAFSESFTVANRVQGDTFDPTTRQFTDDEGTDFVAGGAIAISLAPGATFSIDDEGIEDPGKISLAAIGANVNFQVPTAFAGRVQLRSLPSNADALYIFDTTAGAQAGAAVLSDRFVVLDVRSAGPSNTNVAESIAGAVQNADSGQVEAGTVVEATIRDILRDLGLDPRLYATDYVDNADARSAVAETMLGSLDGAGLYVDVQDLDNRNGIETTIERLDRNITTRVVTQYLLLWYGPRDANGQLLPPSGETTDDLVPYDRSSGDQIDVILGVFDQVTEDCRAWLETADPETAELREVPADVWMNFLIERSEQYPAASQYVIELERLIKGLRDMGLSNDELRRVWSRLELVIPRSIDREGVRRLLSGEQVLQIATDAESNGLEPVIELE